MFTEAFIPACPAGLKRGSWVVEPDIVHTASTSSSRSAMNCSTVMDDMVVEYAPDSREAAVFRNLT